MTLEKAIKDVLAEKMTDGTVENLVGDYVEKGIERALSDLFGSYGDVTKIIEKKLKEVMVPQIENHNFSRYLIKLDAVLTELANVTSLENIKILDNFQTLMEKPSRQISATEIFEKWMKFASDDIETDGLDIDYDDRPTYESVEVSMSFESLESPSWSSFENGQLTFECEHDKELNFVIPVQKWKRHDEYWTVTDLQDIDINSLRNLSQFEVFARSLKQNHSQIKIDTDYETDYVEPTAEPEADWS